MRINSVLYASTLLVLSAHVIPASSPGAFDRTLQVSRPVFVEARSDPGGVVITTGKNGSVRVHAILKPLYGRLDLGRSERSGAAAKSPD